MNGFYRSDAMGSRIHPQETLKRLYSQELAAYLLLYNNFAKSPVYNLRLQQDHKHARRIAVRFLLKRKEEMILIIKQKWHSLCKFAVDKQATALVHLLGTCGADICSDEESENDSISKKRVYLRRKQPWRSKTFSSVLEDLRNYKLYHGLTQAIPIHAHAPTFPPTGTPIRWVDEEWLMSYGLSHVGID
jgi:hypothetical protein